MSATDGMTLRRLLTGAPNRWGHWGADDEIGALNYLTAEEVKRGLATVRHGRTFTLGVPIATHEGDAVFPGRWPAKHFMVADKAGFENGHWLPLPGGLEFADDYVTGFAQAGTHCDGLGHMWFDDTLWNGFPASSTNGGMTKAGIMPIAERGIVGRGVLIDIARFRGKPALDRAETFTHLDLMECARKQGVERVVYTSTVGCIGIPRDGIGDEDQPVKLEQMSGAYKRSKFLAEKVALARGPLNQNG